MVNCSFVIKVQLFRTNKTCSNVSSTKRFQESQRIIRIIFSDFYYLYYYRYYYLFSLLLLPLIILNENVASCIFNFIFLFFTWFKISQERHRTNKTCYLLSVLIQKTNCALRPLRNACYGSTSL